MSHLRQATLATVCLTLISSRSLAATGVCDVSAGDNGASEQACIAAIGALGAGTVVTEVFHDANGRTADQLPLFGKLVDPLGGCVQSNSTCNGDVSASQDQPKVNCLNSSTAFATVASFVNALDWKYANPVRLLNSHGQQAAPNQQCPSWGSQVSDGNKEGYRPWEGLVFDLGGPSNRVALFPINDHGPQPCESIEYTVYLTDNPSSRALIDNPSTNGADPMKWNRAKLSRIYLEGWKKVRPGTDPGASYTIEADSFTSVWSLPCGITFRYVGVIAGNDGKDLPSCNFDSYDAELDAVAGLTEAGAGVCPDADRDGFVSCSCAGAPSICDCDDSNPAKHPGATEGCGEGDLNCDQKPSVCEAGLTCYLKQCVDSCGSELFSCPPGASCQTVDAGALCVPSDCSAGGCPAGSACDSTGHRCVPSCAGVTCASSQICRDGECLDPCRGVTCAPPLSCNQGVCQPSCACFAGDVGCSNGQCSRTSGLCSSPGCANVSCADAQTCRDGRCGGVCDNVSCPATQVCKAGSGGCVSRCTGVTCTAAQVCVASTGLCVDSACVNVTCPGGLTCISGACTLMMLPDGGAGNASFGRDGGPAADGGTVGSPKTGSGCGCNSSGSLLALLTFGALIVLRRRGAR